MSGLEFEWSGPYQGYHQNHSRPEDAELTRVGPGTPCGEYLRRFWQPVAMSSELEDLPRAVRVLGEDLVLFRDLEGRVGLLHRHCSHRGASLEFGIVSQRGIRCCYHGWLFDVDGTILETPGEPATSRIKDKLCHGAYPAFEFKGLVFAYMGPPEEIPGFPLYDTYDQPDNRMLPYSIWHPCNWLQVHENFMDPIHAVFLHTRVARTQLTEAWGALPEVEYRPTKTGMMYVTARRWDDNIWVRSNHVVLPNFGQTAGLWEDGSEEKLFSRVSITRWTVPMDDTHCMILGWRHFNDRVDSKGRGNENEVGKNKVDFVGQAGDRPYEESQRDPGDWDVQVSQRPIAVHRLENLGSSDAGVAMLRRMLRRPIRALAGGQEPKDEAMADDGPLPSYTHDTVLCMPPVPNGDDRQLLREVGRRVTEIILAADKHHGREREAQIRRKLRQLTASRAGAGKPKGTVATE